MAEYKYDGMRVQAHRTADGHTELFTRRQERVSNQFPDVVELLQAGLGPREAILEGEIVAYDAAAAELRPSRKSCSAAASTESPKPRVMCRSSCSASSCCTPMARISPNGPIWTVGPRLTEALTLSDRLRLTTALEVATPALDAMFEQAVANGSEGLV